MVPTDVVEQSVDYMSGNYVVKRWRVSHSYISTDMSTQSVCVTVVVEECSC